MWREKICNKIVLKCKLVASIVFSFFSTIHKKIVNNLVSTSFNFIIVKKKALTKQNISTTETMKMRKINQKLKLSYLFISISFKILYFNNFWFRLKFLIAIDKRVETFNFNENEMR